MLAGYLSSYLSKRACYRYVLKAATAELGQTPDHFPPATSYKILPTPYVARYRQSYAADFYTQGTTGRKAEFKLFCFFGLVKELDREIEYVADPDSKWPRGRRRL
jgi:hypothetical protein